MSWETELTQHPVWPGVTESRKLLKATQWAQKAYPHGPKPFQHSTATKDLLAEALEEVDNLATYFPNRMPHARYCPLRCCIHCKGKHDSEDHHLSLGIPTMPDPDPENLQATTLPTAIMSKQDHTNNRYMTGFGYSIIGVIEVVIVIA